MKRTILVIFIILIASIPAFAQNKTALVIGNGSYRHFSSLGRPYGEAVGMGDALRRLGFDVTLLLNGTQIQMDDALPTASRSTNSRGLAIVGQQPPDSIIVYSAAAGSTAQDGLFTPTLLKYLETPGLEFTDMLRKVRTDVRAVSGGVQRTGDYNQLESEIFLAGRSGGSSPSPVPARVERPDDSGENMVFVAGGTFQMGSTSGFDDEIPVHSVT